MKNHKIVSSVFIGVIALCALLLLSGWTSTKNYTNPVLGYSLNYPADMQPDTSLGNACTVFRNQECQIEVYYQPLQRTNYQSYVVYSNKGFLANRTDHQNCWSSRKTVHGNTVTITSWSRNKLKNVENDFNYYYTADIRKSSTEAYSIFIKSSRDISQDGKYLNVINSFRCQQPKGANNPVSFKETAEQSQQRISRLNLETKYLLDTYFRDDAPLTWGIFEPTAPADPTKLMKLEQQMGQRFKFILYYHNLFGTTPVETVAKNLQNAYDNGYIVELTLQTGDYNKDNAMYDILSGECDAYLQRYAQAVARFEHPVLLRFANEMNGDWCIYSAWHTSKDTEIYKKCYRYIHDIFEKNGANNVLWVWNPNEKSFPDFTWNAMEMYYPGNEYVDIVGLTGYNTGTYYNGETWRSFDQIYSKMYAKYQQMFSQPLMITEFACSSIGGDKAAWIADMFQQLPKYPDIKVAIWWNGCDWAVPGEVPARPYWVNENEQTLNSFKVGWAAQTAALKAKEEAAQAKTEQQAEAAVTATEAQQKNLQGNGIDTDKSIMPAAEESAVVETAVDENTDKMTVQEEITECANIQEALV